MSYLIQNLLTLQSKLNWEALLLIQLQEDPDIFPTADKIVFL